MLGCSLRGICLSARASDVLSGGWQLEPCPYFCRGLACGNASERTLNELQYIYVTKVDRILGCSLRGICVSAYTSVSNRTGQCNFSGQRDRSSFIVPGQRDKGTTGQDQNLALGWDGTQEGTITIFR